MNAFAKLFCSVIAALTFMFSMQETAHAAVTVSPREVSFFANPDGVSISAVYFDGVYQPSINSYDDFVITATADGASAGAITISWNGTSGLNTNVYVASSTPGFGSLAVTSAVQESGSNYARTATVVFTGAGTVTLGVSVTPGNYGFSTISAVPEPATMVLLGTGLAGLVGARRRRKAQQQQ